MILETVNPVVKTFLTKFANYLPNLLGGILVFIIGLLLAQILKRVLMSLFKFFKVEQVIKKTKLASKSEVKLWEEILGELLRWTIVILFLIPAVEIWGLRNVTTVLNQLLFYLPNVLVAVVISFIGLIFANLVSDLVRQSAKTAGSKAAKSLSALARYAIIFFTVLVVLNQLGIAQDLVRILFTGIVAMLSIAGGLAFGLGGRDMAQDLLGKIKKNL